MDIDKIIERIKSYANINTDLELAELFKHSKTNFSNKKRRGTLINLFINWGINENVDLNWLLTGRGDPTFHNEPVLNMTRETVEHYGNVNRINAQLFVEFVKTVNRLESRLDKIESKLDGLLKRD